MKTAKGTVTVLAIAVLVCAGAYFLLFRNTPTQGASDTVATNVVDKMVSTASSVKMSATNAAIDASGIKTKLKEALESKSATIASNTGLSQSTVDTAIDNMNIQSWKVTTLPDTVSTEASYAVSYQGTDTTVTTYSDPSYVTLSALGQDITLSVPATAQSSLAYLPYLS